MRETTVGQLLLERALPPGVYTPGTELNTKNLRQLYATLAQSHPEKYTDLSQRLNEIGSNIAYREGTSFNVDHFKTPGVVLEARHRLRRKLALILKNKQLTPKQKNDKIIEVTNDESNRLLKEIVDVSKDNPLAEQMISGARGSASALKRLIGGDLLYLNHRDEPIPLVVESSYSEGLKPHEYWAATYGARKGLTETKLGVGEGGYMAKLLNQISHRLMVTALDSDKEPTVARGLPVDLDDPDNVGALLAENLGGHKRNTVITPKVIQDLKKTGRDKILIRSPIVGGPSDGGVYARDVGYREYNRLADLGSLPGLTASQALCLEENTRVKMVDGSAKKIKNIKPGDEIIGCSIKGITEPTTVVNIFNNGFKKCYCFKFVSDNTEISIIATIDHKILVYNNGSYTIKTLGELTECDFVGIDSNYLLFSRIYVGEYNTYDIEVEHPDHLFVLENGLQVSNSERLAQTALCLDQDTEVRMADWSVKKIKDIVPGEKVLGCSIDGIISPSNVINVFKNGPRECYETTFRLGTGPSREENLLRVNSTLDHNILSIRVKRHSRNLRPAAEIHKIKQPADHFYAKLASGYDDTGCENEPFALAIGLLLGDGCINGSVSSGGLTLSCWDDSLILDIAEYFINLGCYLKERTMYGSYRVSDLNGGKNIGSHKGIRNSVKKKLTELGLWGFKSYEKKLPDTTKWDNKSVADLIAGLWATDGSVVLSPCPEHTRVSLSFCSSSRQLVEELRLLLMLRFGVYGSAIGVCRKKRKDGSYYRDTYKFSIDSFENVKRFAEYINIPGVKGPRLAEALEERQKTGAAGFESGRCYLISQDYLGTLETCDIEIDHPDHLFVLANGLIVSNSAKHSGGVGGTKTIGGFSAIEQMINIPKHYKDGATHAQTDGKVRSIEPNPLGGWHVFVGDEDHFVSPGLEPKVKIGDIVEAGDMLSEGLPNPSEMVKYKGIGEGSRQFLHEFIKVFKEAGLPAHRRNVELLTRGFINHVELEDDYENWLPGDIAPYSDIENRWKARENSQLLKPQSALGKYLESPVLHYTIGTKIRPSVLKNLQDFGIKQVTAHDDPPPFKPIAIRGSASVSYDPNWVTRLLGSNQQKVLLQATRRGDQAEMLDTSYVPAKAQGELFGTQWPKALVRDFK